VPTIIWPSRSSHASSWRGSARSYAAPGRTPQEPTLRFSGWLIYPARRELRDPTGVLVPLTGGEFDLLLVLAGAAGRVLTRDQLLDRTKGRQAHPFDRSIDVLLSRLRKKLGDDPKEPQLIKTVRGGGYVLSVPVTQA
jgi:two-component system OmpR family response regulator